MLVSKEIVKYSQSQQGMVWNDEWKCGLLNFFLLSDFKRWFFTVFVCFFLLTPFWK